MVRLMKKVMALAMVVVFTGGFALPAHAQATLDDILKRVEALEQENASLKAEVIALKDKQSMQETKIASVQAAPMASTAAATGNFLKTKFDMELYGFVMAQGSYGTSNMASTNTPIAAPKETGISDADQDEFNMGAHDTRLGVNIKGPDLEDGSKVSAKFEMDFSNVQTTTYTPRLRLAYAQLDYEKWAINAGQNWDIVGVLAPSILNPGGLWRQGNIGHRHPQVHVVNKLGEALGGKFTAKTGVLETDDVTNEESGFPVVAHNLTYETKVMDMPLTLHAGGVWGEVENSGSNDHSMWGVIGGMTLKMTDWLSFKAEGYSGAKLDDLYAGSSVGAATTGDKKPYRVKGGFADITLKPNSKVEFNVGGGVDAINDDAYIAVADAGSVYEYNASVFSNVKYNLSKDLQIGLEYQYFQTEWVDGSEGDANRVVSALIYKF